MVFYFLIMIETTALSQAREPKGGHSSSTLKVGEPWGRGGYKVLKGIYKPLHLLGLGRLFHKKYALATLGPTPK